MELPERLVRSFGLDLDSVLFTLESLLPKVENKTEQKIEGDHQPDEEISSSLLFGDPYSDEDSETLPTWDPDTYEAFGRKVLVLEGYGEVRGEATENGFDESIKTHHGDRIWPAADLLIRAFEEIYRETGMKGMKVLELGSGTGYLGLALAAAGADVTLSDLPGNCPLIVENVRINQAAGNFSRCENNPCVHVLHWFKLESFAAIASTAFDLVLVADCIYDRSVARQLFVAVRHTAELSRKAANDSVNKTKTTRIILMNKGRWYKGVLEDIGKLFRIQRLCPRTLSPIDMDKSMTSSAASSWEARAVCDDSIFAFELFDKNMIAANNDAGKFPCDAE